MKIEATYAELSQMITAKTGHKVELEQQSSDTLAITPKIKLGFIPLSPTLNVTIIEAKGSDVLLSYSGGFGVDMIVTGALTFLRKQVKDLDTIAEFDDKRTVRLHLSKISKLAPFFQVCQLSALTFQPDGLTLLLTPAAS